MYGSRYFLLSINDYQNNHSEVIISPFKDQTLASNNIMAKIKTSCMLSIPFAYEIIGLTINTIPNKIDKKYLLKVLIIFNVLVNYILKTLCLSIQDQKNQYYN